MNPGTVRGQSIAIGAVTSALALLGRPWLAIGLAAAGVLWSLSLNASYARRLGDRGRTQRRIDGDRAVFRQLGLSYGIPIMVAVVCAISGFALRPGGKALSQTEIQGLCAVVSGMLLSWLVSSHTDWYYIRPHIDGVITDPPCRTSGEDHWKGVTRKWYIHRTIASLATMAAVALVALIATLALNRAWPSALGAAGGFAAILAVGLWMMRDEIGSAEAISRAIRSPRYAVGDDLSYDTDYWKRRGYVLHVAVPVTKLIPLHRVSGTRDGDGHVEESTTELYTVRCRSMVFNGCQGECAAFNKECNYGKPRLDQNARRIVY